MPFLTGMPSLFCLLVLSGEEVPDLLQKLASEHPDTDPMIKAVSKYHRQEEARHLAFGRMLFPEQWAAAGPIERFLVRHLGSRIAVAMFDTIVHPGVYGTVGLPTWATWRAVNRSAGRTAMRHRALRPSSPRCSRRASSVAAGFPRLGGLPAASTAPVAPSTRLRRPDPMPPDQTDQHDQGRPHASGPPPRPWSASPRGLPGHLGRRRLPRRGPVHDGVPS